ncbi:hypothetical protein M501DRAFT_1007551 [Patellaria atrata CBS 101060]|uniref:LrgB-domain-containing protein n=1 Tax=Patellaria atrata CBS 101060 TaxID=1346257 RepID=A0A9P4S5K3_9PEZI|nr:hypothetical protein M501DRAFT_1007551 [Patellaria atrata CBS 101060]
MRDVLNDVSESIVLLTHSSWHRLLVSWVYIPIGSILILLACWGVDSLIKVISISFPASVACMIVLFFALIGSEGVFGEKKTRYVVQLLDYPCGFSLRWINVFFSPSFILLPLSPAIGGMEIAKIIAVLIIGYIVMFVVTAYGVRGLQRVLGTSKRGMTERAEELGAEDDIPLTNVRDESASTAASLHDDQPPTPPTEEVQAPLLQAPSRAQDPNEVMGTGGPPDHIPIIPSNETPSRLHHDSLPLNRAQRWAQSLNAYLDIIVHAVIFLLIGLPLYYTSRYAMPAQLALNILTYFAALSIPASWRRMLHPVLVSSLIAVPSIWIMAIIGGDSLHNGLKAYKTGTRYIQLLNGEKDLLNPGAGDIFSTMLDVSIVALALPMFQYRNELKRHYWPIIIPSVLLSVGSLYAYPTVCHALGIAPARSLAFASRSLTLALAQPATQNLGGDLSLVAVLCLVSGMIGVLVAPAALKWLRIPEDDYITRGVTLGANSSAIATAYLLTSDPRAAAFSTLSMSLFGTVTVALTSIPAVVRLVAGLAGLST